MTDESDDFDRPRGLTSADRAFLAADTSHIDDGTSRQKMYRIRQRVRSMILDFSLLLEELGPDQIVQIFAPPEEQDEEGTDEIDTAMTDAVALFFVSFIDRKAADEEGWDAQVPHPDANVRRLVREGLRRALGERGLSLFEFELSYSTESPDIEEIRERFLAGEYLTHEEFDVLDRADVIDMDLRDVAYVRYSPAVRDALIKGNDLPDGLNREEITDTDEEDWE